MPRRGRSLRTIRTVRPKFKWSPSTTSQAVQMPAAAANADTHTLWALASNAAVNGSVVPPVLKVRHMKVKLTFPQQTDVMAEARGAYQAYIMFQPQGVTLTGDAPNLHPEWILAMTTFGLSSSQAINISMSPTLSRNLNTGDSIQLLISQHNSTQVGTASPQYAFLLTCQYVARTN